MMDKDLSESLPETPRETALRLLSPCPVCGLALGQKVMMREWSAIIGKNPERDCWNLLRRKGGHLWAGITIPREPDKDHFYILDWDLGNSRDRKERCQALWKRYGLPGEPNVGSGFTY